MRTVMVDILVYQVGAPVAVAAEAIRRPVANL